MTRILVTGGTGVLGREVVDHIQERGYTVRIMSRKASAEMPDIEWAQVDILSGKGLDQAVAGVDVIVNCMSDSRQHTQEVDVDGTRLLLESARAAKVGHVQHVSIVGIKRIPYAYYKAKVAAEAVVKSSGVPWSILRATQFHPLIDLFLSSIPHLFLLTALPTNLKVQSIDVGEVADCLVEHLETPAGLLPDIGGPEVLTSRQIARAWFEAQGLKRMILPLPLPGKVMDGFRRGYNTCPDHRVGKITWAQWLAHRYSSQAVRNEYRSAVMS